MKARRNRALLAAAAFTAWAVHVLVMWLRYDAQPHELLWACHLAPLILAVGCALGSARITSVAVTWTAIGAPLWLGNLLAAGELPEATPTLVHVGTLALAIAAVRTLGWDHGAWWRASLAIYALAALTRLVPAAERDDVNLVFRVWPGLEEVFPEYASFFAFGVVSIPIVFWVVGHIFERIAPRVAS